MLPALDISTTCACINFVTSMINVALKYHYSGVITLAGRLMHNNFFIIVGDLSNTDNPAVLDSIEGMKTHTMLSTSGFIKQDLT